MKERKKVENPSRNVDNVIKMNSFDELFEKKKGGKKIATKEKKEVKRVRGKLSKEKVAKYSKSNHNVFDWLCKGRDEQKEKEKFEDIESNEIVMRGKKKTLLEWGGSRG